MKNQKINHFVKVFVLLSASIIVIQAQDKSSAKKETVQTNSQMSNVQSASDNSSPEARLIEKAYKKMTIAHMAGKLNEASRHGRDFNHEKTLKFKLKGFRVGPIEEIQNKIYRDLVTGPGGQTIEIGTVSKTYNDETRFSITAEWANGQYASGFDPRWTVGNVMQLESSKFNDIGKYASYEVEVSLDNKKKTYRAFALFHNPYQSQSLETLNPEFLDEIIGWGIITRILKENKMPLNTKIINRGQNTNLIANLTKSEKNGGKKSSEEGDTSNLICPADICGGECLEWYETPIDPTYTYCMVWDPYWGGGYGGGGSQSCTPKEIVGDLWVSPSSDNDTTEHEGGSHSGHTVLRGICS